jgi:SMODS domain-containing protein
MAKTLDEAFRTFHRWLTPTASETAAAKRHRASIEACLKANFEITRFFRTGSFGNGTSIRGYSDVDYFASIPNRHLTQNSDSTLKKVWRALDDRFPNTGVGIRTPVVLVPFGDNNSESTDVVPAEYLGTNDDGYMIYDIADRSGGWMQTSPDAHTAYVSNINSDLSGKLKPLIRFVKAWKYYKKVPLYSFYLEMKVARYASGESSIIYPIDLKRIFRMFANEELAAMQDPTGVSGYIYPCFSETMKDDALSKIDTALTRAEKACEAEDDDEIEDAFYWWDLLFDYEFPVYG